MQHVYTQEPTLSHEGLLLNNAINLSIVLFDCSHPLNYSLNALLYLREGVSETASNSFWADHQPFGILKRLKQTLLYPVPILLPPTLGETSAR